MTDRDQIVDCIGRREFLIQSAHVAGGFVLTISGVARAANIISGFADITFAIDDKSPLSKIGGSTIVDSTAGQIIVIRTGASSFVAFSALCTHKRNVLDYDPDKKQFSCSKHNSTFDGATGNVIDGQADDPLPSYATKGTSSSVTVTVGN